MIVRGIIQAENRNIKNKLLKYAGIAVGIVVVGVMVIVHFFGGLSLVAIPIGLVICASEK